MKVWKETAEYEQSVEIPEEGNSENVHSETVSSAVVILKPVEIYL